MSNDSPRHVVLVHGLWVTPRSWEHWVPRYEARGLTVHTPTYPGFEIEVEALRENPDVIATLTVPETVDHLTSVITALDTAPNWTQRRSSSATPSAGPSPSCCWPAGWAPPAWSSTLHPPKASG